MLDKILVFIALAALIAYFGVVLVFVAEPDLIIVTVLVLGLAAYDFWISVFHKPAKHEVEDLPLESLVAGVSGKPMPAKKKPARKSAAKTGSRGKGGSKRKK